MDSLKKVLASSKPDMSKLPGGFEPDPKTFLRLTSGARRGKFSFDENCFIIQEVFSQRSSLELMDIMDTAKNYQPVTIQGMMGVTDATIGSHRATAWSPELASLIWEKMFMYFDEREFDEFTPTDWWQGNKDRKTWEPVGLSPMLRFMRYDQGGQHYAHYDAGYIYPDDNYRTLMSIVIYLTTTETGFTRIINDGQSKIPIWDRDHSDWDREVENKEVLFLSRPIQGNVFVFDHRMCHDVSRFEGPTERFNNPRIIIRGDVLYKAV